MGEVKVINDKISEVTRNVEVVNDKISEVTRNVDVINDKISEVTRNVYTLNRLNKQDKLDMEDIKGDIKALEFLSKNITQDINLMKQTASRKAELDRMEMSHHTDWASSVKGASIVSSPPTYPMPDRSLTLFGIPIWQNIPKPDVLLDPESTGRFWAFTGQRGSVVIRLGQPVLLSGLRVAAGFARRCPYNALPSKLTVWDEE